MEIPMKKLFIYIDETYQLHKAPIFYAFAGFMLLIFGGVINLIVILVLLVYGFSKKEYFEDCKKSILMILINLPIAIFYAWIGLSII